MTTQFPMPTRDSEHQETPARDPGEHTGAVGDAPGRPDTAMPDELRESRRMLATLLSNLIGMAYRCKNNPDWTMEYVSEGCLELTGYSQADLIGNHTIAFGNIIVPEDRASVWEAVQSGVASRQTFHITYRVLSAHGEERWVQERGRGVFNSSGELVALEGYITDVTELQRSQDALRRTHNDLERRVATRTLELELANQRLREQEERFHALADHAGDAIFVVDRTGAIVYANERAAVLTGVDGASLLQQSFATLAPTANRAMVVSRLHRCLAGEPVENPFETTLLRGTTEIPVELTEVRSPWLDGDADIVVARDISERKRAASALQRERQFTDTVLDTVAIWVIVIDGDGRILHINHACEMATGLTLAEVQGRNFWSYFVPEEQRNRVSASFASQHSQPMPRSYESSYIMKDGRERRIAWQVGAAYGDDGSPSYFIGAGMDISERHELEELRIKDQVIKASLVPIGISNLHGEILYVNPALVRRWGFEDDSEILGHDYTLLFQDPHRARAAFAEVHQTGTWTGNANCITRSGKHFVSFAAASLVTNAAGKPILVTSSLIDMTEIHDAQTALTASERRYRRIVETAQEGVWMIDAESRTTFANVKMGEILGYQPHEMLGKHLFEFMDEEGRRVAAENLERRRRGISEQHEFKFQRKDGSSVWALLGTNAILDDNGNYEGALAMVTDISRRKRTEAALAHYAAELERSNQDLEHFAYVASHDLQEPLRMVASYVQLLARQYQGKLDADADQYIAFAVDGAKRMQRLIQDLLALSRVSTRPQLMRTTSSESVLEEVLRNMQIVIEDSGATITHAPLPAVYADHGQLVQLFQNLIGNALKFHGDAPPYITIEAEFQPGDGVQEAPHWLFRITDNGIGIDPLYFERIFEIFQRLHTRDEYSGTGIGLAISRRIVERHGGHIGVISSPGQGATFYFTLPVQEVDKELSSA